MHKISAATLTAIAKQYGTPVWVYDTEIIKKQIKILSKFDVIRYAQKACSNTHILKFMKSMNVVLDAVSLGEIKRASYAGYPLNSNEITADIVFTADLFDRNTLTYVIANKIAVNAGSLDMLEQLGSLSFGHLVWLRINPGFGHGHHIKTNTGGCLSKHGIWHTQLPQAIAIIKKYKLNLMGLHMHIGSGADNIHLELAAKAMIKIGSTINHPFRAISAGGGLSVSYKDSDIDIDVKQYFNTWDIARKQLECTLGHKISLEVEPGRFLLAEAGALISEVRAIKTIYHDINNIASQIFGTNDANFILVDAGFNDLMRPAMYGSYHDISIIKQSNISKNYKIEFAENNAQSLMAIVAGPICESGDVFTQNEQGSLVPRLLPKTKVGDYLVFHDTGAYGSSMSSNYNSRPLISEVLLVDGQSKLIRRNQTLDELLYLECNS